MPVTWKGFDLGVIALVISTLSLIVAAVGTYLSNKQANEAMAAARESANDARWSAMQEAIQRLMGLDPTAVPVQELFANLRISVINLVDSLDWDGFDRWLADELHLGAALYRQVLETASPEDTIDQRLRILKPLSVWGQALSQNLRRLKAGGYSSNDLVQLQINAEKHLKTIYSREGWGDPPVSNWHL